MNSNLNIAEVLKNAKKNNGTASITLTTKSSSINETPSSQIFEMKQISPNHYSSHNTQPPYNVKQSKHINFYSSYCVDYPKKIEKKVIKLLNKEFSKSLKKMFGCENTSNIQKLDNQWAVLYFIAGYIEQFAYTEILRKPQSILYDFLNSVTDDGKIHYRCDNDEIYWNIGYENRKGTGLIGLIQEVFNLPFESAVATAAKIIGLDVNNFFEVYQHTDRKADKQYNPDPKNKVLRFVPTLHHDGTKGVAHFIKFTDFCGFSNQIIGSIAHYDQGENQFCVPVSIANGERSIGKHKANAYLLNQNIINRNPYAKVLLFYDVKTAIKADESIKGLSIDISDKYVITAHFGENIDVVQWEYLFGRDIVYINAPCENSFENIEKYVKKIMDAGAKSINIYPHLVLHSKIDKVYEDIDINELNQGEQFLINEAIVLSEVDNFSMFVEKIVKHSFTYQDFVTFWTSKGLFSKKNESIAMAIPSKTPIHSSFKLTLCMSDKSSITTIVITDVFPINGIATLRGPKNGGKSYIILYFISWIINGSGFLKFQEISKKHNVLLIDSETIPDQLVKRIHQMKLADCFEKSFFVISKEDPSEDNIWKSLDLLDKEYRDRIERYALENNISYIFCDNLTSLISAGKMYEPKAMTAIYEWSEDLRKIGICLFLGNHNGEKKGQSTISDKARGSNEFSIRSHSEIVIIGSIEIIESKKWPKMVKKYTELLGLTLGLCFKTCKMASILENKVFWLHLPLDASEWELITVTDFEGEILHDFINENSIDVIDDVPSHTELIKPISMAEEREILQLESIQSPIPPLLENAKKILDYLHEQNQLSFNKKDITNTLGLTDAKFRNAIENLKNCNKIEKHGEGKGAFYSLI